MRPLGWRSVQPPCTPREPPGPRTPPPPQTPPPPPLLMFEADSQSFASAPPALRRFQLKYFWRAFGGDHRGTGGGGVPANPPPPSDPPSSPPSTTSLLGGATAVVVLPTAAGCPAYVGLGELRLSAGCA